MSAYILVVAAPVITAGRMGDIVGPRVVFIAGMILFTVASALCGAAGEPWQLIAARAAQGAGAALITPQTLTILTAVFPPDRRGLPSAVWGVTAGPAGLAGPTLGGLLVAEGGWRWIFHVNVPIGIVTVIVAFVLIPGTRPGGRPHLDLTGALLATAALGAITYGLLEGDRYRARHVDPVSFRGPAGAGLTAASPGRGPG
ncbi:MFS transporter [Streptosporangium sp. H16]|uniref:MFS transporter n=1 Tax=Streptosporangium sp. H16 TaxID=3444184 RepID=UPI003F7A538E